MAPPEAAETGPGNTVTVPPRTASITTEIAPTNPAAARPVTEKPTCRPRPA